MVFTHINDSNYIHIEGFMRTQLNLKGNELLVYAIIYGFSQDGKNHFVGSINYLTELIGTSRKTIFNVLQSLCNKNLIIKTKVGNYSKYAVNLECVKITPIQNNDGVKITPEGVKITSENVKITPEGVKITPKYKDNIKNKPKDNNKAENSKQKSSSKRKTKKEKGTDLVVAKFEEYDFSERVKSLLLEFYDDRMDNKDYPASNQLTIMFNELSQVSEQQQYDAISNSIKQGYKGIFINKNNSTKQSYRLDTTDLETVEEHNQRIADIQDKIDNNSGEVYRF